jgi:hypothetical protein
LKYLVGWKKVPTFAPAKQEDTLRGAKKEEFFEKTYIKQKDSSTRSRYGRPCDDGTWVNEQAVNPIIYMY